MTVSRIKYLTVWKINSGIFITGYFPIIATIIEEYLSNSKLVFGRLPKTLGVFDKGYELSSEYYEDFIRCLSLGQAPHYIVIQTKKEIVNKKLGIHFYEGSKSIRAIGTYDLSDDGSEGLIEMGPESAKLSKLRGWC